MWYNPAQGKGLVKVYYSLHYTGIGKVYYTYYNSLIQDLH